MGSTFDAETFYRMFVNAEINENAAEEWSEYREKVTDFIIRNSDRNSTLSIYGAGKCNDMNLERLSGYFSEIVLLDRDLSSMEKAAFGKKGNVSCRKVDFVGIDEEYYIRFINYFHDNIRYLRNEKDYSDFGEELLGIISDAYASIKTHCFSAGKKTDYSLMLGLHSQLNNSFSGIWNYVLASVAGLPERDERMLSEFSSLLSQIEKKQSDENAEIVRRVNDSVLMATGKGVFMGYELCLEHMRESLIEGAYQASRDFEIREKEGRISCSCYERMTWPLNRRRNIVYEMILGKWNA